MREQFQTQIETALAEAAEGRRNLIESIAGMAPSSLEQLTMESWLRLGLDGIREVLQSRFPGPPPLAVTTTEALNASSSSTVNSVNSYLSGGSGPRWSAISVSARGVIHGIVVGLMTASAIVGLSLSAPFLQSRILRSEDRRPHQCVRLTPDSDNCIYAVTTGISWQLASSHLKMQEALLRSANQHLARYPVVIPKGALLRVRLSDRDLD